MTNVIGSIALTYERACDFRYDGLQKYIIGDKAYFPTIESARNMAEQTEGYVPQSKNFANNSRKQKEFNKWMLTINALDPYIQRAIYQYWKATALFESKFREEALTALRWSDKCNSSIPQKN